MTTIEIYNPNDKTLIGPAEEALRLPGVVLVPNWTPEQGTNADGTPYFNYERKQQHWKVVSGDVNAKKLIGGTDNPELVDVFIPEAWATKPNIQTNPSKDGVVFPYTPIPLRGLDLNTDEKLAVVRVGIFFPAVWLRRGTPPAPPAQDGSFGKDDRDKLDELLRRVRSLTV